MSIQNKIAEAADSYEFTGLKQAFHTGVDFALSELAGPSFDTALDYIKDLCDILEDSHTRNHQETLGNAIMNAMAFYDEHRPRKQSEPMRYSDGLIIDDLPF